MNCPICNKEMKKLPEEISHNPRDSKEYVRTVYQCEDDDAWVTTELPVVTQLFESRPLGGAISILTSVSAEVFVIMPL